MPDTEQQPPSSAPEKTKRSRITAACAVCRAKRQKCSGEKPICDQCRLHNEDCWWSDQKKRGPAKDYLRSLQDRLQETERLLLGVLDKVSDPDLLGVLHNSAAETTATPSHQTWTSNLSGPDYWSQYPLNRIECVREWQTQRVSDAQRVPAKRTFKQATGNNPRTAPFQPAPEASMGAPTAVMAGNSNDVSNGQHPYYTNGLDNQDAIEPSLRFQPGQHGISHERRYSEETRGVAEALFSMSDSKDAASRQQLPQPNELAPNEGEQETRTSPKPDSSSDPFPKHLFW